MKLFKKFHLGQWNVHAFEEDGSQDAFIGADMLPIKATEADLICSAPPSKEYEEHMRLQLEALGRIKSWPPREYKEALGQICVNSASLESTMRTLIWAAAGMGSETGMIFTGGKKSTTELGDMLQLVVKQRAPDLEEKLKTLMKEVNKAFENRGIYVHSVWTVGDGGIPLIGKFFSEKTSRNGKLVKLEDLEGLAIGFGDIEGRLSSLVLERFVLGIAPTASLTR
ncbi:MAG: hypothetical protein EAZ11_03140 [Curvibacter sp.]|nr:MAG: hypothetical protein EAZ11_03140 [Curvibacter sp.]